MPYRRGHSPIPGREHVSAFFSDFPEPPPWPSAEGNGSGLGGIHRVMRLVLACGFVAAGLCLVLGMTTLAVTMGSPGHRPGSPDDAAAAVRQVSNDTAPRVHASRQAAGSGSASRDAHGGRNTATRAGRTIASLHGTRGPAHARFVVTGPGAWGVSWSFSCPAGRTGHLVVRETSSGSDARVEIDGSGRTGGGTTWNFRDPGDHSLVITSVCPWALRVVLPRAVAAAGPSGG